MTEPVLPATRNQSKSDRKQLIVDTTIDIITQHGLADLAIADIAEAARLSPGQIYRIFDDKDAIVVAAIASITEKRVSTFSRQPFDVQKKAAELAGGNPQGISDQDSRLLLELLSLRNSKLHKTVIGSEQRMKDGGTAMLQQQYPQADSDTVFALAEIIATLSEGAMLRKANGFPQRTSRNRLQDLYTVMLSALDQHLRNNPDHTGDRA